MKNSLPNWTCETSPDRSTWLKYISGGFMDAYGKRVLARIKAAGLPGLANIAEEELKVVAEAVCDELVVEVQGNNKAWDDFTVTPIKMVKDIALKLIDKISP
jgi:hypothetical protein